MFEFVSESFKGAVNRLRFVDGEKALKDALKTLKKSLLRASVHHKVTKELLSLIEDDVKKNGIGQKQFLEAIKKSLEEILSISGKNRGLIFSSEPPTIVLTIDLRGGGKTASAIKLTSYLKLRNKRVLITACDLQHLAAVEQLRQLCEANEIELFYIENETNPIKIAGEALRKAKSGLFDVLPVNTAGRLTTDKASMGELKEVKASLDPDEIFYVADAMSGQGGAKAASSFSGTLGLSRVILSKFDADTKGDVALGIARQINIPLRFIGVDEKVADLEIFIPDRIVGRIMGEGDLATLAEKTAVIINRREAKELDQKIEKGNFNFNDFLTQMGSAKKLGGMKSLIGVIPGLSNVASGVKDLDLDSSKEILHIKAVISSMTPGERKNLSPLNSTRKRRIASDAGFSQTEVNRFLKQFNNATRLVKKFFGKKGMDNLMAMMNQARRQF